MRKIFRAAFPHTIPVMTGYLFIGFAFGVLFRQTGFHPLLAALMSVTVYAGSLQYMSVAFLQNGMDLITILAMSMLINARHIFYGLPFIEKFGAMGRRKPYMVFSLTDETFSLLCSATPPPGIDERAFLFCISLLDQAYWIAGSALGAAAGSLLPFNTKGIEFAMTALFVVIFVEQWRTVKTRLPALAGFAAGITALLVFGGSGFILPAMAAAAAALLFLRKPVESKLDQKTVEAEPCKAMDTH